MFSFLSQFMSLHKEQQIVDKLAETIRLNPDVRRQFETSYAVIKTEPDHPLQENAKENAAPPRFRMRRIKRQRRRKRAHHRRNQKTGD